MWKSTLRDHEMMASKSRLCAKYVALLDQKVNRTFDKASLANFSPQNVLNQTSFAPQKYFIQMQFTLIP